VHEVSRTDGRTDAVLIFMNGEEAIQRFRNIVGVPGWVYRPSLQESLAFERSLYVSGYWNDQNGDAIKSITMPPSVNGCPDGRASSKGSPKRVLYVYARLLQDLETDKLLNFVKYTSVQIDRSGMSDMLSSPHLKHPDDAEQRQRLLSPEDVLGCPGLQVAFILCMHHYFI
jgi:hypothetical protein